MSIHNLINQIEYDRREARNYVFDSMCIVIEQVREGIEDSMHYFILGECKVLAQTYGWLKTRNYIEQAAAYMFDKDVPRERAIRALNSALSGQNLPPTDELS
jgi:hypothetical protein